MVGWISSRIEQSTTHVSSRKEIGVNRTKDRKCRRSEMAAAVFSPRLSKNSVGKLWEKVGLNLLVSLKRLGKLLFLEGGERDVGLLCSKPTRLFSPYRKKDFSA